MCIHQWPSTHTISMVWQSLASLSEDLQSLWAIYKSFLEYWDHYCPSTLLECLLIPSDGPLNTIQFQYPPVMLPVAVHYHIFIVAFTCFAGPEAAMQVLVDMHTHPSGCTQLDHPCWTLCRTRWNEKCRENTQVHGDHTNRQSTCTSQLII